MIRALWFFLQLVAITVASVWILERPGSVVVDFMGYTVTAQFGFALLVLAVLIVLSILLYRVLKAVSDVPALLSRKSSEALRKKGMQSLTRGFAAIAAGNAKEATKYARLTRRLLADENGLLKLLEAQAARLRGEEGQARKIFKDLLEDRDAAFFGIRGLLKSALDHEDYELALDYARQALTLNPKQPWILNMVYDLELQTKRWNDALKTAKKAVRYKAMDKGRVANDEIAILLHRARQDELTGNVKDSQKKIEQAYRLDKFFIPTVLQISRFYMDAGKKRKVKSIIEKAWKKNPHPDLLPYWDLLAPTNKKKDPMRQLKWYEKILALKPDSVEGQIAVAKAAIKQKLWGEAKAYLNAAEKIHPIAEIYRLRAEIEKQTTKNEDLIRHYLEEASEAAAAKVWYCKKTGTIYNRWHAIAEPHGTFNTIEWGFPQIGVPVAAIKQMDTLMFEANAA